MNAVQYIRNFRVGTSTHIIRVYSTYTVEHGLDGLLEEHESTRMAECLRGLDMTPAQATRVRNLMREKQDGIVLASGEYRNY